MKVISDPETGGLQTSCLILNWGLSEICQVHDCNEKSCVILSMDHLAEPFVVTICKKHYEEGKAKGKIEWQFDDVRQRVPR